MTDGPLIVQSDKTLLLEVEHELAGECRRAIAPFAELERSPEHVHTYRITPLSLWNAAAAGITADEMVEALSTYSKFPLPPNLSVDLRELVARYGRVRLVRIDGSLRLVSDDTALLEVALSGVLGCGAGHTVKLPSLGGAPRPRQRSP